MNCNFRSLFCLLILTMSCLTGINVAWGQKDSGADLMQTMMLTSKAFRAAAQKVRPSLVTIESFGGVSAVQGRIGGIRKQGEGNTTGLVISKEGHIISSSFNFIQSPPVITVITSDGKRRFAKLLGRDETRKICLLKINSYPEIELPEVIPVEDVSVGQWAISVGVGYGDANPAISTGIISAVNRVGGRAIQTDANTSPANYGGPLLDIEGRVMGICVPLNPQSAAVGAGVEWYDSGIGFAIPLSSLGEIIERMKKNERIYPAFLGVQTEPGAKGNGVGVVEVIAKSAAEEAGVSKGDTILKLNGSKVNDLQELRKVLKRFEAGMEIEIEFASAEDEEVKKAKVVLGRPPAPKEEVSPMEPPKIQ